MELPEAERAELARFLLLSLEPEGPERDPNYEAEWAAEIKSRSDAVHEGKAILLSREEVEEGLRRKLQQANEAKHEAGTPTS
jgi:putative addiction module component (TIGR02574 family)